MRIAIASLLLLPASLARAEPLSGFDAWPAWDQALPGLLEFVTLDFTPHAPAEGVPPSVLYPAPARPHSVWTLTAAAGGTTLRALERIRLDGPITLIGDFTFDAPTIEFGPSAQIDSGGIRFAAPSELLISPTSWMGGTLSQNTYSIPLIFEPWQPPVVSFEWDGGWTTFQDAHPPLVLYGGGETPTHFRSGGTFITSSSVAVTPTEWVLAGPTVFFWSGSSVFSHTAEWVDWLGFEESDFRSLDAPHAIPEVQPVPLPAAPPLLACALGLLASRLRRRAS